MSEGKTTLAECYRRLVTGALVLTLIVVVMGAWVRLTDAGLGCPDWPGCYGTLSVPDSEAELRRAAENFPERPVEAGKAWREMIHRYAASLLGLFVIAIAAVAWTNRRDPDQPWRLPLALVAVVIAQGMLGMFTVTLLLKPLIVMAHLLGGMTTLGLLCWLTLSAWRGTRPMTTTSAPRRLALVALIALGCQIALGGWTSTNYAALACPDFPTCQTQVWPDMDFKEGFILWRGIGVDYEGGILDNPARTAIHMVHRIGAVVLTVILALLLLRSFSENSKSVRRASAGVAAALGIQLTIGIAIIVYALPLSLATAHNAGAALLLLALLNLNHTLRYGRI